MLPLQCDACGEGPRMGEQGVIPLKRCGRCRQTWYHDVHCQRQHFREGHREVCRATMASDNANNRTMPQRDWRQECVNKFGLTPVPETWATARLNELSQADNETWKKYYDYRLGVEREESDNDADEELLKTIKDSFKREMEDIVGSSNDEEARFLATSWFKHSKMAAPFVNYAFLDEIRTASYSTVVFSPFIIPHALELSHRFHNRSRRSSCEFYVTWDFKLVRFDGKGPGDGISKMLSRRFPAGWNYPDDSPCIYNARTDEESLCSNSLIDPPNDAARWCPVEHIDVSNLTPATLCRIRTWLYGSAHKSEEAMNTFSFLRLLFAAFGCAGFKTPGRFSYIGYEWQPFRSEFKDLIEEVIDDDPDDWGKVNWLEYQVRLISGTLRPLDKFYQHYDILEAKGVWGTYVLEERAEKAAERNYHYGNDDDDDDMEEDDDDDDEELKKAPWMVWEEEARGRSSSDVGKILNMMRMNGMQ